MNIALIFITMLILVPFIGAVFLNFFYRHNAEQPFLERYILGFSFGQLLIIKVVTILGVFDLINFNSITSALLFIFLFAFILDWQKDWQVSFSCLQIYNSYKDLRHTKITWLIVIISFILILALIVDFSPPRHADMLRYHLEYSNYILNSGSLPFVPHNQLALASDAELLFSMVIIWLESSYVKLIVYINLIFCFCAVYKYLESLKLGVEKYAIVFFIASPILFLASTIVKPDTIQLLYFVVSLFLINQLYQKFSVAKILLTAIFIGEVISLKWTGLLPVLSLIFYLVFLFLAKVENRKTLLSLIVAICIGVLIVPIYWYLRNYFATGNPIWPLMNHLFMIKDNSLLYEITSHSSSRAGKIEIWGILGYFFYTFFIYTPSLLGGIGVSYYLALPLAIHKGINKKIIHNFIFILIYLIIWFQIKASFRHLIWLLPFISVIASYGYLRSKKIQFRIFNYLSKVIILLLLFQILFISIYSVFYAKNTFGILSEDEYFETTPNYYAFKQAEKDINNPLHKVLVIIPSSEIYYFKQPHIDGNRTYSAIIDYYKNNSVKSLLDRLHELDVKYILFENQLINQEIYGSLREIIRGPSKKINQYESKVIKNRLSGKYIIMNLSLIELEYDK